MEWCELTNQKKFALQSFSRVIKLRKTHRIQGSHTAATQAISTDPSVADKSLPERADHSIVSKVGKPNPQREVIAHPKRKHTQGASGQTGPHLEDALGRPATVEVLAPSPVCEGAESFLAAQNHLIRMGFSLVGSPVV